MVEKRGLTPGGYRDPDAIFGIRSNERVHKTRNGHEIRDKATGEVVREVARHGARGSAPTPKAARTPGVAGDGWQAYVEWTNTTGTAISLMQATWVVPPMPAEASSQTVFLFPGIENLAGDVGILQPVLQWGVSHIGGGPYWAVASWYVPTTGEAFYSNDLVPVHPGQALTGLMRSGQPGGPGQPGFFNYDCAFDGVAGTDLATGDLPELTWATIVLEAYGVANRNQYPAAADTTYAGLELVASAGLARIPWSSVVRTGAFGESATPVNDAVPAGRVDIGY